MQFQDKVVLVTGAAGGLGGAIVRQFATAGATVVAADLRTPDPDASPALFRMLDVTAEADWMSALDWIASQFGGLDVLVNNAGFFKPNVAFEDMPLDLWRRHFAVNSDGVFLGCKHAILHMKSRGLGGAIVNMGSGMSIKAQPTAAAYCAAKASVLMTTRTAAAAAARYKIRVNAILPGPVPTAMLMGNMVDGQDENEFLDSLLRFSPLGRLATADDVARAVLFLADPQNGAITGVYLPVDAGAMPGA